MRSVAFLWRISLFWASLACLGPWGLAQAQTRPKLLIPDARGSAATGKGPLIEMVRQGLGASVDWVGEKEYLEALRALRIPTAERYRPETLVAAARHLNADYVLAVDVVKKGWLYTAYALLYESKSGEARMNFSSGYYKPRPEAADRGNRIARTTRAKLDVLLAPTGAPPPPPTQTSSVAVAPPPPGDVAIPADLDDATRNREEEMFGAYESDSNGDGRDAEIFGGGFAGPGAADNTETRLDEVDKKVAAGGRLFLRLNHFALQGKDNFDFSLESPNLLDLYVDARLNERLRGYAQTRLIHNFTQANGSLDRFGNPINKTQFFVDQLWLKFDLAKTVYITAGKQRVKWGVNRFWNTTDFLNSDILDPLAVFDQRLGVSMVRLHLPVESLNWNFYSALTLEDAGRFGRVGGALRGQFVFGAAEISLSAAIRDNAPARLGADISMGLWIFDLRAEAAFSKNVKTIFYRGEFDAANGVVPTGFTREDDWIPQIAGGAEAGFGYGEDDAFYLGVEYFYNGSGYSESDLYSWIILRDTFASQACVGTVNCPPRSFTPLYLGEHYLAAYLLLPGPGSLNDHTFQLIGIGNLSDRSGLARFDYQVQAFTFLSLNFFAQYHFGRDNGEFRLRLEFPPIAMVPALSQGLSVPPQVLDLGVGLSVNF